MKQPIYTYESSCNWMEFHVTSVAMSCTWLNETLMYIQVQKYKNNEPCKHIYFPRMIPDLISESQETRRFISQVYTVMASSPDIHVSSLNTHKSDQSRAMLQK